MPNWLNQSAGAVAPVAGSPRRTIPDDLAARLRGAILSGEYQAGDALPPERTLASELGTNRNTLREAVRLLEESGLVRARQGHGVRVLDFRRDGRLHLLPAFLAEEGVPGGERLAVLADALALRTLFLGQAAAQAAERRTDADAARLRAVADRRPGAGSPLADVVARDLDFYAALTAAAHSQVGTWAYNTFAPALTGVLDVLPALWVMPPRYEQTLGAVVDAVVERRAEAARSALNDHLTASDAAVAQALAAHATGGDA